MAKKVEEIIEPIKENISVETMEDVMGSRYATYAKYVIQDRAIPDVRDGLKPVQRRIIFSMYKSGNTFNKPTRKCAHTVGAVMGTYHPHGDTSIYEALARMSQDWKVRYPLIDFQGNNGSIDGDYPAAYRYTESRLSELSNELVRDIEKKTVDMQLNFDDTELEPVVLPSRFPNLLANGTEGIAVALATEIPPHNLREIIDATIYRINHKTATAEDLLQIVQGPDFPGGGFIYNSEGLRNIYLTGRGRIEIVSKTEITSHKDQKQIIITEIPFKVMKNQLVYEIDKIIHSRSIDGMIEIRDESDWKGIRIVIDCKKDAKCDLILKYLMQKTSLLSSYSANMVAIVDGKPKTLNLLDFIDAYIKHQVDVITRQSRFDLNKDTDRLHIVEGLILASININEAVDIIKKSKDKADSKVNLMKRYGFSNEQAEAIVTMPLYKLSHTDEEILENEKKTLLEEIDTLKGILEDPMKLNRVLIRDLKQISDKYGDDRRTQIIEKEEVGPIDKRELIAKENVYVCITRDGYAKRCTLKSMKGSGEGALPGLKEGDAFVTIGQAVTTDYLICFTNIGNYVCIPVHKLTENRWKDEGTHINSLVTLGPGEKLLKSILIKTHRNDIYLAFLTKFGQIKRMCLDQIDTNKHSRPVKCMKLLSGDEITGIQILTGNSDLLVITSNGNATFFNENDLSILGSKAGGVKSVGSLGRNNAMALVAIAPEENAKVAIITDAGHQRILDSKQLTRTARLGRQQEVCPSFKGEPHKVVNAIKVPARADLIKLNLFLNNNTVYELTIDDFRNTQARYAKKNIDIPPRTSIEYVYDTTLEVIDDKTISFPILTKEPKNDRNGEDNSGEPRIDDEDSGIEIISEGEETVESLLKEEEKVEEAKEETKPGFEQISIFDDDDE